MKKITFLLFTIFLITFKTSAQDSKIKFGIQGGLNYSGLRGYESFTNDNPGFAYLFGFSFEHEIQENLSIKVDLNYERKTQISKSTIDYWQTAESPVPIEQIVYKSKTTIYLNYIVLPILIKYNLSTDKSFYINGGPYLGYLLKSGMKSESNYPSIYNDETEDTNNRKSIDYGISAGIGKEFKLSGNHNFHIELRDNLGLANIAKGELINGGTLKTNSLNLLAGFTF
ncbi:PorT family protein [Flavobacterium psychroterrae]|uniref:PorT family protein n=1 Tax=Flavobacterium psychroterrae TaxID=2133767 RepID=A0ABS5PAU2_9FLAO|nr:porin family protein [Flavobacterium psychroterrae]MBS7231439.1 PorT family protein [Flavobacterium psychroterrae]